MKYSIDTSAIIEAWVRHYPPDIFPTIWTWVETLVDQQIIAATEVVLDELKTKDDDVYKWARNHKSMFITIDADIQVHVSQILADYPRLVMELKRRSRADPFVIALARMKSCAVVTFEQSSGKLDRPRIPDVCQDMGIPCITLVELFRREGLHI